VIDAGRGWLTAYLNGRVLKRRPYKLLNRPHCDLTPAPLTLAPRSGPALDLTPAPRFIWTRRGGIKPLEVPEGYVRSEANAVNNDGVVVGMVDGPNGSEIGPDAFVYEEGRLRLIDEGGPAFTAATAINDQGQVAGVMEKEEGQVPPVAGQAKVPGS
jgi:hypothetical protein